MTIELKHISKSFNQIPVLRNLSLTLRSGDCHCLMSPSGSGKTTLLRILMGLETADSGEILTDGRPILPLPFTVSAVFQEDRLCESFSPVENIAMCAGSSLSLDQIRKESARLLPPECLSRPVSTLSGGMKRRTAVLRALLSPSHLLIMDEPFTGMDQKLKQDVISYIKENQRGRILIFSTHQEEDVSLMGGRLFHLS